MRRKKCGLASQRLQLFSESLLPGNDETLAHFAAKRCVQNLIMSGGVTTDSRLRYNGECRVLRKTAGVFSSELPVARGTI